ncbi:hypothetical protein HOY82DRAFT_565292 [Tuber indicum]|nr:hypothetical protein HOY82DRAFT_565292 [Tuber indicum]
MQMLLRLLALAGNGQVSSNRAVFTKTFVGNVLAVLYRLWGYRSYTVSIDLEAGIPVALKFWSSVLPIVERTCFPTVFVFENFLVRYCVSFFGGIVPN